MESSSALIVLEIIITPIVLRVRIPHLENLQRSVVGVAPRISNQGNSRSPSAGAAKYRYVLTVQGRKSGLARSTPVDVMEVDGPRWPVAPYGAVNWVTNVRAAGQVELA